MALKPSELAALKWAVEKAEEHGSYTGEPARESAFLAELRRAQMALKKLSSRRRFEYKSLNISGNLHDMARGLNQLEEWNSDGWELAVAHGIGYSTVFVLKREVM